MFEKAYVVFGWLLVAGYAAAGFTGYELFTSARDRIPDEVRNTPGGLRTFHFWHSGYHGGK